MYLPCGYVSILSMGIGWAMSLDVASGALRIHRVDELVDLVRFAKDALFIFSSFHSDDLWMLELPFLLPISPIRLDISLPLQPDPSS